jgi:hypothetical protein
MRPTGVSKEVSMSKERSGAATVVSQEGDEVQVEHGDDKLTARMVGFPPGFRLRPGERVILRDEASGVTARPLVVACRATPQNRVKATPSVTTP